MCFYIYGHLIRFLIDGLLTELSIKMYQGGYLFLPHAYLVSLKEGNDNTFKSYLENLTVGGEKIAPCIRFWGSRGIFYCNVYLAWTSCTRKFAILCPYRILPNKQAGLQGKTWLHGQMVLISSFAMLVSDGNRSNIKGDMPILVK